MTNDNVNGSNGSLLGANSGLDPQSVIQAGTEAAKLLGSPVYNVMYQRLLQAKHQEWLATHPKETQRRESLFHQSRGLVEITEQLGAVAQEAQELLRQSEQRSDPEVQRNEYLDNQGFGLTQ